jgi:hypothetical protein
LYPIGVVLPGDALLDRQPHDLVHGAALALGLPSQEGGFFVGEPEGQAMLDEVFLRARELLR